MTKYLVLFLIIVAIALIAYWMGARSEKGKNDTMPVTPDTTIHDILSYDEDVSAELERLGLHCSGCPSAVSETLEQACTVHNITLDEALLKLNDFINEKEKNNGNQGI